MQSNCNPDDISIRYGHYKNYSEAMMAAMVDERWNDADVKDFIIGHYYLGK